MAECGDQESLHPEMEMMDQSSPSGDSIERSSDYYKLLGHGLKESVAASLEESFKLGKLFFSDLDERALEALKEFPETGALAVLKQFVENSLEHVSNKSAYLCGVMKTYRQKSKLPTTSSPKSTKGPNENKLKCILDRTKYSLDVTTGQRKYGGPPPNWNGPQPSHGCEIFVGKIPKDIFEDELIPLFESCGKIWDLRLMMDPLSGLNRGYAFITFCAKEGARNAVKELDNYEIRKGKYIGVTMSVNNHRLFVGNIPKNRGKDELFEEFAKRAPGLTEVIIYSSPDDNKKNRGFCFLEYDSHKAASLAKRRLTTGRVKVWGCDIVVDWADPQEEPDDEVMAQVRVLYVRNLTSGVTEDKLKDVFETYGRVDRVKKIKDYAFVHFEDRNSAVRAMDELNHSQICGVPMEISLAKPPSDKKKKEEVLRNREKRMMHMMQQRAGDVGDYRVVGLPRGRGGGRQAASGTMVYDYDYDYYGFVDYVGGYGDTYYEDYFGMFDDMYDYGGPAPRGRGGRGVSERGRGGRGGRGPRGGAGGAVRGRGTRGRSGRVFTSSAPAHSINLRGNLVGKRKFDGTGNHQAQGESKRRLQNFQIMDDSQFYQDFFI